jgi:hypothetical protein
LAVWQQSKVSATRGWSVWRREKMIGLTAAGPGGGAGAVWTTGRGAGGAEAGGGRGVRAQPDNERRRKAATARILTPCPLSLQERGF